MFAALPTASPFSTISKLSSISMPAAVTATPPIASSRSFSGSSPDVSVSTTTQRSRRLGGAAAPEPRQQTAQRCENGAHPG